MYTEPLEDARALAPRGCAKDRSSRTSNRKDSGADELWLGVKCHSNPELAARNALSRGKVSKDSVQLKPTREKLAGGFLFSDRKRKENALLRPDLKVDENTRLVNQAS
ncbi:hypothetical protein L6452_36857 [Arctium lappa]|uniref:Uncharacterized protein n=1 Tax=Arctium lappa TaxID=4217 RepID=A0ACB8Y0S2_ARCLA|nr:hypothetical protein L6452_36857 [Arctium lappa]